MDIFWNILVFWIYKMLWDWGVDVKNYMEKLDYLIENFGIESLLFGGGIDMLVV